MEGCTLEAVKAIAKIFGVTMTIIVFFIALAQSIVYPAANGYYLGWSLSTAGVCPLLLHAATNLIVAFLVVMITKERLLDIAKTAATTAANEKYGTENEAFKAAALREKWECELLRLEANLKRELTDNYSQKLGEGGHGKALADIDAAWTLRFNERVNAWKRDNLRP